MKWCARCSEKAAEKVQTKSVNGQITPLLQRQVEEEELRRQPIEVEELLAKTTSGHIPGNVFHGHPRSLRLVRRKVSGATD